MGLSERSGSTVTSSETTAGRVVALAKVTATLGEFDHINFVEKRTEKLLLNCAPAIGLTHLTASLSGKLRHCSLLPAHRNARWRKI